jgi:hypothetical protein
MPVLGCQSWPDGVVSPRATEIYYDTLSQKASCFIGMNGVHTRVGLLRASRSPARRFSDRPAHSRAAC